jgi:hypothetical protein
MSKKAKSGGGLTSNKLVRPSVKVGQRTTGVVSVAATDMQGQAIAFARPDLIKRQAQAAIPLGNAVAASTQCGVGGSRTVMRSGSQGFHGTANPGEPKGRMESIVDRGSRQILGPPSNTGAVRRGQQRGE